MLKEKKKVICSDNWNRLVQAIPDIEQLIIEDRIKVIRLKEGMKEPLDKDYYFLKVSLEELKTHNGNFGIIIGYNNGKNGSSIAVADIDGYTINKSDNIPLEKKEEIKQYTKEYIYNKLKTVLPNALSVKTQSAGYHFYLWNETEVNNFHKISNSLTFPSDFPIEELRNKSLKHSIELFTKFKSRYVVLPTAIITKLKNKDNKIIRLNEKREYTVINDVTKLSEIDTVNNLHNTIKEKMVANGFGFNPSKDKKRTNRNNSSNRINNSSKNRKLKQLSKEEIKAVVDLTTTKYKLFEAIDGEKHYGALALGGYFSYHISKGSAERIATGIIKKVPSGLFRNSADFKRDILISYERPVEEKQGLPTLIEYIEDNDLSFNTATFSEELNLICNSNYIKEKVGTAIFKAEKDKEIEVPIYLYETYYKKYLKYQGILEGIDLTLDLGSNIGSFIYSNTGKEIDSFKFKFNNKYFEISKTTFKELTEFLAEEEIVLPKHFEKNIRRSLKSLDKSITKPKIIEETIVKSDVPDSIVFGVTEESYYQQTEKGIEHIKPTQTGYKSKPIANVVIKDVTIILDSLDILEPVYNITYYNKTFNKEVTVEHLTKKQLTEEFDTANVFYNSYKGNIDNILHSFIIDGTKEERIEVKVEAYLEGFYIVNGKVVENTKLKNLKPYTSEDVAEAITLLNEIMKDRTEEGKANDSTVYRFSLWNPFSYCLKQIGFVIGIYSLILIGKTKGNKTGAIKIGKLFYLNTEESNSGSTVSVLGSKLEENSFSKPFDESYHLLNQPEIFDVMKKATQELITRITKDRNDNKKNDEFNAIGLPSFLLNERMEFPDYIRERYKITDYTNKSYVSKKDRVKFNKKYLPDDTENTVLRKLAIIGNEFKKKIIPLIEAKDKRLLKPEELTIEILKDIAKETSIATGKPIDFLSEMYTITEPSKKYDYDVAEAIRNFLNKEFKKHNKIAGQRVYSSSHMVSSIKNNDFPSITYDKDNARFIFNASKFEKYINNHIEETTVELEEILDYLDLTETLNDRYEEYKKKAESDKRMKNKIKTFEEYIRKKQYLVKGKNISGFYLTTMEVMNNVFGLDYEASDEDDNKDIENKK